MSKLFIYCNYSILFNMSYCIGSRCRRVAVLNRKVSNLSNARRVLTDDPSLVCVYYAVGFVSVIPEQHSHRLF